MNIPARYCTGYLGEIGVPLDNTPMDFNAGFQAYLGDRWFVQHRESMEQLRARIFDLVSAARPSLALSQFCAKPIQQLPRGLQQAPRA